MNGSHRSSPYSRTELLRCCVPIPFVHAPLVRSFVQIAVPLFHFRCRRFKSLTSHYHQTETTSLKFAVLLTDSHTLLSDPRPGGANDLCHCLVHSQPDADRLAVRMLLHSLTAPSTGVEYRQQRRDSSDDLHTPDCVTQLALPAPCSAYVAAAATEARHCCTGVGVLQARLYGPISVHDSSTQQGTATHTKLRTTCTCHERDQTMPYRYNN